jgi:hypothetical protein
MLANDCQTQGPVEQSAMFSDYNDHFLRSASKASDDDRKTQHSSVEDHSPSLYKKTLLNDVLS